MFPSLHPDTMKAIKGFGFALFIVVFACALANHVRADGPPAKVIENISFQKKNQKVLEKNRGCHEEFMVAKEDNERREQENVELGWATDWASMSPVPIPAAPKGETPQPTAAVGYDPDKLCRAIAMHETGGCTKGVGPTHNNCIGMKPGGKFKRYPTKEDSIQDCVRVWKTYYKKFPNMDLARTWSGNDRAGTWLANVTTFYAEL